MSGQIIETPQPYHRCELPATAAKDRIVWECSECKFRWTSIPFTYVHGYSRLSLPTYLWHRESTLHRWRRRRREAGPRSPK